MEAERALRSIRGGDVRKEEEEERKRLEVEGFVGRCHGVLVLHGVGADRSKRHLSQTRMGTLKK